MSDRMIWGYLVHLSFNMWSDRSGKDAYLPAKNRLQFDRGVFDAILKKMKSVGANTVVIDIGDGVRYRSHPEIAVKGAWPVALLRRELARIRAMGIEPIPKLNFSTCHDHWLGPYSRMVSTPAYYRVCRDLISEVARIFDRPRFFHLGMDEETAQHQRTFRYVVIRQHDLWWHDMKYLLRQVERAGVRPWIWSDYIWHHGREFLRLMPRSVLQSNWYYGKSFSRKKVYVESYVDLEKHGYDQVPTGANIMASWAHPDSFPGNVRFCTANIGRKRLKGFLQTLWKPTTGENLRAHMRSLDILKAGREIYERMNAGKGRR